MSETREQLRGSKSAGRIEGGIDAIVIGAGADGLAAAAYLGRAGLHTILAGAGAEIGGRIAAREIAPGVTGVDGEHLITHLDPDVIAELELYRHGLEYAARRLDTTYYFDDGTVLRFDGDLAQAALLSLEDDREKEDLERFVGETLELSAMLRPAFAAPAGETTRKAFDKTLTQLSPETAARLKRYLSASADEVLAARFGDGKLRTLFLAEAAFRSAAPPHEKHSFMTLLRRFSGEAAGLQGAAAYPAGGALSVIAALRRAAQAARVDVRAATPVVSILVEGDRVAGVTLADGGQLRAPIVIASVDADQAFLKMIGPAGIDIELQRLLTAQRPRIMSARLQIVLKGVAEDDATRRNMMRRLVYAPSPESLNEAFIDARAGRVPAHPMVEVLFPSALDEGAALDKRQIMSVIAHPMPFLEKPDKEQRKAIGKAILASIEKFAAGFGDRIETVDLRLPSDESKFTGSSAASYAAKPDLLHQWALSTAVAGGGRIDGFYFCGPEAQIGAGISGAAGRAAAKAALRAYRKGGV